MLPAPSAWRSEQLYQIVQQSDIDFVCTHDRLSLMAGKTLSLAFEDKHRMDGIRCVVVVAFPAPARWRLVEGKQFLDVPGK